MLKHITRLILIILLPFLVKGQDTLFLRNGTSENVKVLEIDPQNISYLKSNNLNGPKYVIEKSNIAYVKFQNNVKEIFSEEKIVPNNVLIQKPQSITYVKGKLIYMGHDISNSDLMNMISSYPVPQERTRMELEYKKMKRYKRAEGLSGILIGTGFLVPTFTTYFSFKGGFQNYYFVPGIIVGALLRISGFVMMKVFGNKERHQKAFVVDIYNNLRG